MAYFKGEIYLYFGTERTNIANSVCVVGCVSQPNDNGCNLIRKVQTRNLLMFTLFTLLYLLSKLFYLIEDVDFLIEHYNIFFQNQKMTRV